MEVIISSSDDEGANGEFFFFFFNLCKEGIGFKKWRGGKGRIMQVLL